MNAFSADALVEASREMRGRFYALVDTLSTLRELADVPVRQRDEGEILAEALETLTRHHDLERCSVFVRDDDALNRACGPDWGELMGSSAPTDRAPALYALGQGFMGEALASGTMVACDDCANDPRFAAAAEDGPPPAGSMLCAPIPGRVEPLGVVNVFHADTGAFHNWHRAMLSLFCCVLGHMVENARLVRGMERTVDQRTRQLEAALRQAEQLKRRYEHLSIIDELTDLPNRRFFFPEAEAALANAVRYGAPFSVVLLDVDHFKRVNDRFGHAFGDAVLRDVAGALREKVREGDLVARFGGEEFVVALPSTDLAGARAFAERLRAGVGALAWRCGEERVGVTVSVGVTALRDSDGGQSRAVLEALLRETDIAMYFGKRHGRDAVNAFSELPPDAARMAGA